MLEGTVIEVAPLPDAKRFRGSNLKVYSTKVEIDRPLPDLRPGMSATVDILIDERDNVVTVPVQAVVTFGGKHQVAMIRPAGDLEWRSVVLGRSNDKVVEFKRGIESGDVGAIDPRSALNVP